MNILRQQKDAPRSFHNAIPQASRQQKKFQKQSALQAAARNIVNIYIFLSIMIFCGNSIAQEQTIKLLCSKDADDDGVLQVFPLKREACGDLDDCEISDDFITITSIKKRDTFRLRLNRYTSKMQVFICIHGRSDVYGNEESDWKNIILNDKCSENYKLLVTLTCTAAPTKRQF